MIGDLGKVYPAGNDICREGDAGDCMYVIQQGEVEVLAGNQRLRVLGAGEMIGEMALFTRRPRSATVRALSDARVLTIDKRGFLKRVQEDPSLAFRILQNMSTRIETLSQEVSELRSRTQAQEAS
jgi:CRP-like cAMP-binding protein